jgi:hypothetical protein
MPRRSLGFVYGSPVVYPGGARVEWRRVSANYACDSAGASDYIVGVDTTGGAVQLTLPPATRGRVIVVKDVGFNAAVNNITVVGAGGAQIDGAASSVISTAKGSRGFVSDGTAWFET